MRRLVQLIDQPHVSEDISVPGVINCWSLAIGDLDDPAGSSSTRKTEGTARATRTWCRFSRIRATSFLIAERHHGRSVRICIIDTVIRVHHRDSHVAQVGRAAQADD